PFRRWRPDEEAPHDQEGHDGEEGELQANEGTTLHGGCKYSGSSSGCCTARPRESYPARRRLVSAAGRQGVRYAEHAWICSRPSGRQSPIISVTNHRAGE